MRNQCVLISGIGIAGPTLAYWLLRRGFRPTLVERAPRLRTGGYIIDFWGLGHDIAEKMGLLPALAREGYEIEELRFVDRRGRRVGGFGVDVFRRLTGGRYVSMPRSALAELIYHSVEGTCETIFGDSISSIEQEPHGVRVDFERGSARHFDLVIGADGLHSRVRRLVFGPQDRFESYLGYAVAAFEVSGYRPRDEGVYVCYSCAGKQVARFAMREDRTLFLLVFAAERMPFPDPHDACAHKAILHNEFGGVGWEGPQILAALDSCEDLYFDRVSQINMPGWTRGRIALVGDAAFCPSLLAGQGAALAMTAAYVLAGELGNASDRVERAFNDYQDVLGAFMASKQRAARQFARSFVPRTRFGLFARNQISNTFRMPLVANLALGHSLLDRLALPNYPGLQSR